MKKLRCVLLSLLWIMLVCVAYVALRKDWEIATYWSDGFFIGGLSLVCFSLLTVVASKGAFDIFAYPLKKHNAGDTFYDYSQRKEQERKNQDNSAFLPTLLTGLFFVAVAAVILYV